MLTIRPARPEDAVAICGIWNPIIRDTDITFTTEIKRPVAVAQAITDADIPWLVAEEQAVLGFVSSGPFRSGPGYALTREHSIYVSPDAAGRGVGNMLLRSYEAQAREAGLHVLVAGISGTNSGAIAFHARHGYTQVADMPDVGRKNGKWLPLVLMQKILS